MNREQKIDFFRQLKLDYKQPKEPLLFTATKGCYLAINGSGRPGGTNFRAAVEALYSMAYTIKMTRKAEGKQDYVVCKLEALWWTESGVELPAVDPELWRWKLMIRTPDAVADQDLERACQALLSKGKVQSVKNITIEELDEGLCVQVLHVGPYEKEHDTIHVLREFMKVENLRDNGPHHEIYISDPRRVDPEKLKTILRQPVVEKFGKVSH